MTRRMSVDQWALVALGLAMLASAVLVLYLTRRHNLSQDELNFMLYRGGRDPSTFLEPYNEHIILGPLIVYKTLFQLFGVGSYWPYRVVVVALHLLCAGLLYALARRRMGAVPALVPAVVLLFLGTAWEVVLQLALIVFLLPLAAGLGMLLALEREDRRGDLIAAACLLVALTSGSLGVVMAVGAIVTILLGPRPLRRLGRVVAGPLGLYLVWVIAYGESHLFDQWLDIPRLVTRYLAANVAALTGFEYGTASALWTALVALLAVAVVYGVVRRVEAWRQLVALSAMVIAYWVAVVLFRPELWDIPSRYVYPGSAFLLVLMASVWGKRRIPGLAAAGIVIALAVVVVAQFGDLREGARSLDRRAEFLGPSLGALELARDSVSGDFVAEPLRAPGVTATRYFKAVEVNGSPADTAGEIADRSEEGRRAADIVSSRALGARLIAIPRDRFRRVEDGCRDVPLAGARADRELPLPPAGLALRAPAGSAVTVRLRRFADGYGPNYAAPGERFFPLRLYRPLLTPLVLALGPGEAALVRVPADRSTVPWHVRLSGKGSAVVCSS